jgi:N-acetylneuraminic acid mutarotase
VTAANGRILEDLPEHVIPTIVAAEATRVASIVMERYAPAQAGAAEYVDARLEVFVPSVFGDDLRPSRLAWFVEATAPGVRQFVWIDAENGEVLLTFNQAAHAKNRQVYNANSTNVLPGTLARSEGQGATGAPNVDRAYDYTGDTYGYFKNAHNRDSFDNAGTTLVATVDYCPDSGSCPYANAFWNGAQIVFGDGLVTDDVVAHEWTHAVTEESANLYYYSQSGALNESFSDVFGEAIDLLNGSGTDTSTVRWQVGEDITHSSFGGAIRHMMTPTLFGHPGKVSDIEYQCDAYADQQGVHGNSGVPNHAFALLVDGGSYNGRTIAAIGLSKAAKIWYRALTVYLTSGSGFADAYDALTQSATDLIGTDGITSADRTELIDALLAVEMSRVSTCTGATATPPMCTVGAPTHSFHEGVEAGSPLPWGVTGAPAGDWFLVTGYAKTGLRSFWGENRGEVSDHRIAMTSSVMVPVGGRAYFDHSYRFEASGATFWDGGVVEYSVDNGSTWVDAGPLMDAGREYAGTIITGAGNPLSGRPAFVGSSLGYTGTRLNLATFAGQSLRLRFRIGTDPLVSDLGWFVDNISIYSCASYAVTPLTLTYGAAGGTRALSVTATPGDAGWTVESDEAWLTASPGSGVGSKPVTVTAAAYATSVVPRTATLTFRRGDGSVWRTVAATQTGPAPTLGAAPLAWTVDAAGGTREITVTAVPGDAMVAWTAVSNAPAWLTVSAAGGTGSGTVTLTAAAQPSAKERVGAVTLAGKVVTVRQRGALPVLTLTPPTWDVGARGGTQPVTLTATPSDVMWTAVSSGPWLRVNGQGTVTGTGTPAGPWTLTALAHTTSVTARTAVLRAGGTWQTLPPLTVARWGAAVGEIDGRVYVAGGQAGTVHRTDFSLYTVATNTWTALAASGVQTAPVSAVHDGKLYVAGGRTASGPVARLRAYDPTTAAWTELASMPTARAEAAGGVLDGVLYVAGGQLADGTASDVVEAYDITADTWTTVAPLSEARAGAAAAVLDGTLYVVGGTNAAGEVQPTLFAYDPGENAWTARPALPVARTLLTAVAVTGALVVVGGSTSATAHGSTRVDMYDAGANTWRPAASLPTGRSAAGVVALHDRLYVLGGALRGATLVATGQAHVYTSVLEPTVVVTQAGATAIYGAVTPLTLTYGAAGGTRALSVTATPGDAGWTVESDEAWLTASPGSGVGSKPVTVTAAAYATSVVPRTATLTFRRGDGSVWRTVAVTQTGPPAVTSVSPTILGGSQ